VNLARARVTRLADGTRMSLRGQSAVRPVLLDGGAEGGEILAYVTSDEIDYRVDLSGVVARSPAGARWSSHRRAYDAPTD